MIFAENSLRVSTCNKTQPISQNQQIAELFFQWSQFRTQPHDAHEQKRITNHGQLSVKGRNDTRKEDRESKTDVQISVAVPSEAVRAANERTPGQLAQKRAAAAAAEVRELQRHAATVPPCSNVGEELRHVLALETQRDV